MRLPFFVQVEGYFLHVLRVVHGCFALEEYFVHVFRAVHGYFALEEYFVHVLRVVCLSLKKVDS